jgi:CHASE2 domain-containing sensor protein
VPFFSKAIIFLLLCGVGVFFLQREEDRGTFASVNQTYIDWLIGNSKQKIQEPSVTLLRIDEGALEAYECESTFGPLEFAQLLNRLNDYMPKVAAIEPVLEWKEKEELLLNALRDTSLKCEKLLLGSVLELDPTGLPLSEAVLSLFPAITNVKGELTRIPEFTGARDLPELQLRITSNLGFTAIDLGEAVAAREDSLAVPLLARDGEKVVPGFVLQAVMLENGVAPESVEVDLGKEIRLGDTLSIPIDARGYLTVFAGLRERLPSYSASILIWKPDEVIGEGGNGQGMKPEERTALESRVVLIGYDNEPAKRIPLKKDVMISRAELFALAIATVQSGRYIRLLPETAQYGVWAVLVLAGLFLLRFRRQRAFAFGFLLLVLYFIGGMLLFQSSQTWMPVVIPLGLIGCLLLAALVLPNVAVAATPAAEGKAGLPEGGIPGGL